MEPTTYEATRTVNVRTEPSMQAKIAAVLQEGQKARIVNVDGEWAETSESEYIKIEYLRALEENDHEA